MATLTPAQRLIADQMIQGSFDAVGAKPSYLSPEMSVEEMYRGIYPPAQTMQAGMMGRGLPPSMGMERLPQGEAGLPNPSPGSGMTPQEVAAMGGWAVDPLTGKLAYSAPKSQTPALQAATAMASGVPLPQRRPAMAPTRLDMAAINAAGGNRFGLPTHEQMMAAATPLNITVRGGTPMTVPKGVGSTALPARAPMPLPRPASLSPSQAYDAANIAGQIAAQQRGPTGQTGVYQYVNGQKVGTVGGGSSAQAYARAAERSVDRGTGGEGGNPTWW